LRFVPPFGGHRGNDVTYTVIYSKFHRNPFRGFGALGVRNLPFLITLAIGFYDSLYYRTSRDHWLSVSV